MILTEIDIFNAIALAIVLLGFSIMLAIFGICKAIEISRKERNKRR